MNVEYLIASIGKIKIGIDCHDILNVYRQTLKILPIANQHPIYTGIASLTNKTLPVIDLRKRAKLEPNNKVTIHNIITFQTSMSRCLAVLVDDILGMESLNPNNIQHANNNFRNQQTNLNLLFPSIAILKDQSLLYIMDSTYLDKLESVTEESGELELF